MTRPRTIAVAVFTVIALAASACSDDGGSGPPATDGGPDASTVLDTVAGEAIVPAYESLVTTLETLGAAVDALCAAPSPAALDAARAAWREVALAWRHTRAGGVGPAMERRLAATIGFRARAASIDELLGGIEPVDIAGLEGAGAAVKGISALEIGLFGEGADELAAPGADRRCTFLASVTSLAADAATTVRDDWESYRATFAEGMDGDAQSSVDALVNEAIFRVTELDDQGLRALVEATSVEALPPDRADGPAAFHLAELDATLAGAVALLGDDADDGRLLALVAARSADTAARLQDAATAAETAMASLPDSVAEALESPDAVAEAQAAVTALKVLLATEVASELGVTMGFSDADGDS